MKDKLAELKAVVEEQLQSGKGDAKTLKLKELLDKLVQDKDESSFDEKMTQLIGVQEQLIEDTRANKPEKLKDLFAEKQTQMIGILEGVNRQIEQSNKLEADNSKETNRLTASLAEKLDKVVENTDKEIKMPPDHSMEVIEAIKSIDVKPEVIVEQKEYNLKAVTQVLGELFNAMTDFLKKNVFTAKVENSRQKPLYVNVVDKDGKIIGQATGNGIQSGPLTAFHTGFVDAQGNEKYALVDANGHIQTDINFSGTVDLGNVGILDDLDNRIHPATEDTLLKTVGFDINDDITGSIVTNGAIKTITQTDGVKTLTITIDSTDPANKSLTKVWT